MDAPVNLNVFKQVAFSAQPGQVSPFVPHETGGFLIFVKAKLPLDKAQMEADLPEFTTAVRRTREGEAFNRWFGREAEVALRNTPVFRQQQQPGCGRNAVEITRGEIPPSAPPELATRARSDQDTTQFSIAFCTCSRFSAWSKIVSARGPRSVASSISLPR